MTSTSLTLDAQSVRTIVRDAWAAQLGTQDFKDDESFFLIGGDSLLAVRAMKQISHSVGRKCGVRLLFENQSLDELSACLARDLGLDPAAEPGQAPSGATVRRRAADRSVPEDWAGTARTPLDPDTVFNGFVAANVVFSMDRLGLLDRLVAAPIDLAGLHAELGHAGSELVRVAADLGYVTRADGRAELTPAGREMHRMRGYFTWSVGGYHDVFRNAADIITGHRTFGNTVLRDEAMVAIGAGQNGVRLMGHILDDVVDSLDFSHIADLGSGDGSRLGQILRRHEGVSATGYDISGPATALARQGFAEHGLAGRAEAVEADVLALVAARRAPRAEDVDVVLSVFLLHDLLADPDGRAGVLPGLREAFPQASTFVLADTMLRSGDAKPDRMPVFSSGYELAHALMGVPLHTTATYEALFEASGLHPRRVVPFGTPHSWLYVLDAH